MAVPDVIYMCFLYVDLVLLLLPLSSSWDFDKHDSKAYTILGNVTLGSSRPFKEIADDFWQWRLEQSPEFATTLGIHDYDDRLETFTIEAFRHRKDRCDEILKELDEVDMMSLSESDANNLRFLEEDIKTYIKGYRWSRLSSLNPMNHLEGIHKDYSYWLDAMKFEEEEDFMKYIQRLRAVATQVNEQISLMREAIRIGWTNHKITMEPVIAKLAQLDHRPTRTAFNRPFNDSIYGLGFSSNKIDKLKMLGEAVIYDHVLPAYKKLRIFLSQEYLPNARPHIAISSLPGGYDFYREVIRWHLSLDARPEELHEMGRRLTQTLRDRIDSHVRQRVGYLGDLDTFMRYTQKTPKFFHISQAHLFNSYKEIVYKEIRPKLSHLFKRINLMDLELREMPFDGPPGVAMPPSDDGTMPGIFFVNVRRPHKIPKWKMMTLSLREALPGHHLQSCYALNASIPIWRRKREQRKMFAVPFQFPFHTAYAEGWAGYAETLGRDMNLFKNHFDEYGSLLSDLINTVRLVVDTGIHAHRWSRERAIRYYVAKTGESRVKAEEEVDRFIAIPGQALQYKIGHMKIEQLRFKAERLLGEDFNIKEFHHQILRHGAVSLKTLDQLINTWIYRLAPEASGGIRQNPWKLLPITTLVCFFINLLSRQVFLSLSVAR